MKKSSRGASAEQWLRGPAVGDEALKQKLRQLAGVKKRMMKSLEEGATGSATSEPPRPPSKRTTAVLETQALDGSGSSPQTSPPKPDPAADTSSETSLNIRNLRRDWETPFARHKEKVLKEEQRARMKRPGIRGAPDTVQQRGGGLQGASETAKRATMSYQQRVAGGARGEPFVLCADEQTAIFTATTARAHGEQVGWVRRCECWESDEGTWP